MENLTNIEEPKEIKPQETLESLKQRIKEADEMLKVYYVAHLAEGNSAEGCLGNMARRYQEKYNVIWKRGV